jgi:hypothetical protein
LPWSCYICLCLPTTVRIKLVFPPERVFRAAFGLHVILSIEDIVLSGEAEQGVPVVGRVGSNSIITRGTDHAAS